MIQRTLYNIPKYFKEFFDLTARFARGKKSHSRNEFQKQVPIDVIIRCFGFEKEKKQVRAASEGTLYMIVNYNLTIMCIALTLVLHKECKRFARRPQKEHKPF
jgi:hypothetical protein